MSTRRILRVAIHLFLAAGLVLPGIAASVEGVRHALATTAPGTTAMTQSACDGMPMPDKAPARMPQGAQHGCDLSACLGAGCLPTLPHVVAFVPDADSLIAWDQPLRPSRVFDTPLRPPIA